MEWVHGDSRAIGEPVADLVVMSGNVAQAIIGADWPRTLSDIHGALRPGGALAFESRNPSAQAWQGWTRAHTYGERETPSGPLAEWLEVTDVEPDDPTDHGAEIRVTFAAHNVFGASGEHLVHTQTLAFRSRDQLRADLAAAGLELTRVTADWQQEPVTPDARLLVVEARRPVGRSMGGVPRAR